MLLKASFFGFVFILTPWNGWAATPNADDKYQRWPDPGRILYSIAADFDPVDLQVLHAAMQQFSTDTSQCVKFQPYDARLDAGKDFVFIANRINGSRNMPMCYTFPGRSLEQRGHGQYMVLFSSRTASDGSTTAVIPGACLDSVRDAMKYFYHLLGFRSEYGRVDRVNYLDFPDAQPNNLVAKRLKDSSPLRVYLPGEASFYNLFDPLSITMVDGKKWAQLGMNPVFVPRGNVWIGGKPNLSQQDCQALAVYSCDTMKCQNPYLVNNTGITVTASSNPVDANGICLSGQTVQLGFVMASGLQSNLNNFGQLVLKDSNPSIIGGTVVSGQPVNQFPRSSSSFPTIPEHVERSDTGPYIFSIVGSNPQNFQLIPDQVNPAKATIVLNTAVRGFTNAQITVQATNSANPNQYGQTIVAMNLNCGPIFSGFPSRSAGTSPQNRATIPTNPIKGVACDGGLLSSPIVIGAFTAVDPDNEPVTYYLTMSNKFQISSAGVLVLIQAPTIDATNVQLNVNAMDIEGAVSTVYLTVSFSCSS